MSIIKFIYENNIFEMIFEGNDSIKNIIDKYMKLLSIEIKDLLFLYKGINILEKKDRFIKFKNKNIIISIINKNNNKNRDIIELKNIICPDCKELAIININEENININCINNHKKDYFINSFIESQNIKENEIKCNICKNKKCLYNDNFYICTCNKYICQLCMNNHIINNKEHNLLYYNMKFSSCNKHMIAYISYCSQCKLNLCENCEKEHYNHKIIYYKKEKEKLNSLIKDEITNEINEKISNTNKYKEEINTIKYMFVHFINRFSIELDNSIKLYNKMILLLDNLNTYENVKNILNFKNTYIYKDINDFLNDNTKNKLKHLEHKFHNYINENKFLYKINKNDEEIKLFGENFVKNNKDNYYLIIDNKIINLSAYYHINIKNKVKYLKVLLLEKNKITDMSSMFWNCTSLSSLPDISKWNTNDVTDMSDMFRNCSSLYYLPDISKWNTNKVTNMSSIFSGCSSLYNLPDISKWNTNEVTNMACMFSSCKSLSSLPDISIWNVNKVTDMSSMFSLCSSLYYLPDISKWNTNKVTDMSFMFTDCKSLYYLPDISKWNTSEVTNMRSMFWNCSSLSSLPDISKWDTNKVTYILDMFYNCKSSLKIPKKFV